MIGAAWRILPILAGGILLALGVSSGASLSDQVTSNGNRFNIASMSAPALSSTTAASISLGSPVSLTVTPPAGNFSGTTWDILRGTTCSSLSFLKNIGTAASTTDTPAAAGTYCYATRGKFNSWSSAISGTVGPFTVTTVTSTTNLQTNATLSTATTPAGNVSVNHGLQLVYKSSAAISSANNQANWTVVLVLRDKPGVATSIGVDIWWEGSSTCSATPVAGQIFASGSVTVPIAVDKQGVTLTIPAVAGSVSHTFVSTDRLCLRVNNPGAAGANDLHYYLDTASTSGAAGFTRLIGPFTP
jgi:hypothetical protein